MTDDLFRSATETAADLRCGELSSRELTESLLARIDAVDPTVNAIAELRPEAALAEATRADDAAARGTAKGALHGVPMTVKEALHLTGMRTTWGDPEFAGWVADRDATAVRRLREAGAVIVGKSNLAFMLGDFAQTANELYGTTSNPWDTTRTPGGSSGGAAAAVAAGMSFLEYGSDLVGSIRIPASFCGVYGLKPSVGTVPLTGFAPPGPPAPPSETAYLSALGPLARSAPDLRTALRATAGPENPAARAYRWALPAPRHRRIEDFRVGVVLDDAAAPVSGEVDDVLSAAVDALAAAGVTIVEGWPDGIDPARHAETFGFHVALFFAHAQPGAGSMTLAEIVEQEAARMASRAAWERYFENIDVFLCPTNVTAAFPHDTRPFAERTVITSEGELPYDTQAFWVAHAALAGLPAVSAPIGRTVGNLPVGVQILAPLYEDDTAITFAELAADVIGGYQQPPEWGWGRNTPETCRGPR